MKNPFRVIAIVYLACVAVACSSSTGGSSTGSGTRPPNALMFPAAPAEPVVEWVASYAKRSDVDPRRHKLRRVLVGEEEREPTLMAPTAVAISPDDTLFVVDQELRGVVLINAKARRFEIFQGTARAPLAEPIGVAVAEDGTFYVSDARTRAVYGYDLDLRLQAVLGSPETFVRPTGLALSADGERLAVCDTRAHKVYVLDTRDGSTIYELGGDGQGSRVGEFNFPVAAAFDEQGYLYIADLLNFRIQIFDGAGDFDMTFGQVGDRPGDLNRPRGLAADSSNGLVYEVDAAFQLVQMFNLDGELLMWFGSPGEGPAQFSLPTGIGRRGDILAVADTLNHRVQVFRFLGSP